MKKSTIIFLILGLLACQPSLTKNQLIVKTMGTTGSIKFISQDKIDFKHEIDSILIEINSSLSTWIDTSTISKYNKSVESKSKALLDHHFRKNLEESSFIFKKTNGSFNPAIKPLINYWSVQSQSIESYQIAADSVFIDSLVNTINQFHFLSTDRFSLDFSAIAKGYAVDEVAAFLNKKGIENYLVEIGGEVICRGKNSNNKYWKIGIEEPNEKERNIYEILSLKNAAMATSGNYRNFKILDSGQKIVHIINPKTGHPEISNLLSASIVAPSCMEADAYATACMVMGMDGCFDFVLKQEKLECYLLYSDKNGQLQKKFTKGFENYFIP